MSERILQPAAPKLAEGGHNSGVLANRNVLLVLIALLLQVPAGPFAAIQRDTLPASLTDAEFWSLTESLSEPDGYFRSNSGSPDNLLSNERDVSTNAGRLASRVRPAGVYLGVGPEQNFTYIAAMKARIAFITDIRRGNLHLHLLYKSLFESSADRVEFVGRLFSRKRPEGLTRSSSAAALMNAYLLAAPVTDGEFQSNLKAVVSHLTKTRALPLSADDAAGIEYVYGHFYRFGPAIHYTSSIGGGIGRTSMGSYAAIMQAIDDATGTERTYLASEDNFAFIKTMHRKNLIVPVVGDFAGPKALRGIGTYLKEHGAVVSAFYVSNVEDYLQRNRVWRTFCLNVATMPQDASSVFIRSGRSINPMLAETSTCAGEGPRRSSRSSPRRSPPRRSS